MAFYQSKQIVNNEPLVSADGATETIAIVGDFTTVTGMVTGEIIEMVGLPAGYVPVDVLVAYDASAAAAWTADCGVLSGNYGVTTGTARTQGNEAFAANSTGQGAAGLVRAAKPNLAQLAPADNDRGIGLKIVGTLTTLVVGTNIRMTLLARAARNGV
ncbi:MAG: hypothetical protein QG619_41 [Pseudomonadota bacterium]|jgi:hypothetical protein|nr:hypothetical protein [Pseudomonadota bacterium]